MPSTLSNLISDASATDQQFQDCADRGLRYAMAILHNHSDSEEAVQETFFRLHRHSIECGDKSYRGMFFKTLRNHCIDLLRKRRVRNEHGDSDQLEQIAGQNLDFAVGESSELKQMIFFEISHLPESMKQALLMRVHGQLSYDEIANALDASKQQVRTWIYRARRKLEQSPRLRNFLDLKDE